MSWFKCMSKERRDVLKRIVDERLKREYQERVKAEARACDMRADTSLRYFEDILEAAGKKIPKAQYDEMCKARLTIAQHRDTIKTLIRDHPEMFRHKWDGYNWNVPDWRD